MERIAYSISDATKALGLGRTTIYSLISQGRLETIKLGRRTLIKAASLHKLVETA
jgi:excisionase family DNA binding protein